MWEKHINHCFIVVLTSCALDMVTAAPLSANTAPRYSPAATGFLGLNTIPSARMDTAGTVRIGVSTLDPYLHGYVGIQLTKSVAFTLRQSAEISGITDDPDRFYPGLDLKIRILKEDQYRPEISIGAQSAIGDRHPAGEYLALSKRYGNFDFTAGLGWGRFGTAHHFQNPLSALSGHFNRDRDLNSDQTNTPNDWFTGQEIGVFAGFEYFLPYDGLSIKVDYGADRYSGEMSRLDFERPAPWGIGLSYTHPNGFFSGDIGTQGGDKVMARLSLQTSPEELPFGHRKYDEAKILREKPSISLSPDEIRVAVEKEGIKLFHIYSHEKTVYATVELSPAAPAPQQIGRAARYIANYSGHDIESIVVTPHHRNMHGHSVEILRTDVEKAMDNYGSSSSEIWKNTTFAVAGEKDGFTDYLLPKRGINKPNTTAFALHVENTFSLSEEDSGVLARNSIIAEAQTTPFLGFIFGGALRLNTISNLDQETRVFGATPFDETQDFAETPITIENAYIAYTHSFTPELHAKAQAGYLEEQYLGGGAEILYRPHGSRFAVGAEGWLVSPRQANTILNAGTIDGLTTFSGHVNGWYDLPMHDATLYTSAGRFVAGDGGITIGLKKGFQNGATLKGEITLSRDADLDIFGGETNTVHRVAVTVPIGNLPYITEGSTIRTIFAPFDQKIGRQVRPPVNLYTSTERFSFNHMASHWHDFLK
ncbi:MAG: hypothetical protein GC137_08590 [Alphaproteobacteria bacterium]|nr:hypothetical protein [Alphaproteobacteria bacterium]